MSSKEELFLQIRRDSWREGLSVRALARKYRVHRRLVREALSSPVPAPRRHSPRLDPFKKTIDRWLLDALEAPPKQRHTVKRILTRLQQEFGAEIAYSTVWDYVHRRRQEIAAAAGTAPAAGFVIRYLTPDRTYSLVVHDFHHPLARVLRPVASLGESDLAEISRAADDTVRRTAEERQVLALLRDVTEDRLRGRGPELEGEFTGAPPR
ncbi:hypothetical protein [Streptomyces sp. NPDC001401]|uniref:hypothetical protein n=1 Tax=Streptomyces sp. NPDC001401 TaxID=3364570 RepID=UPI0036A1E013